MEAAIDMHECWIMCFLMNYHAQVGGSLHYCALYYLKREGLTLGDEKKMHVLFLGAGILGDSTDRDPKGLGVQQTLRMN